MSSLESTLAASVQAQKVPQVVVVATNREGTFTYKHTEGSTSAGEDAEPIQEDAIFLLASCSKLFTSVAALQIVERGLIGLDDDIAPHLPELARQPILEGFDEHDKPILRERKNAITLRLLLTHTSGAVYDAGDADVMKFQAQRDHTPNNGATVTERFAYPLVFEPGTAYAYGSSIDWAGLLIERLTNDTLETFMQKNIWTPLDIFTMTFFPGQREDFRARIPQTAVRTPEGKLTSYTAPDFTIGGTGCFGGHGLCASMSDYHKLQLSLLRNDGKVLSPGSVDQIFTPQLDEQCAQSLTNFVQSPMGAMFIGEFLPSIGLNWGLGGVLFMQSDQGRRREGTLGWGGMMNSFWTLDRVAGIALVFGTQMLPPGDGLAKEVITAVEKGVYKMAGVADERPVL